MNSLISTLDRVGSAIELFQESIRYSASPQCNIISRPKMSNANSPWCNRQCQLYYDAYAASVRKCMRCNSPTNSSLRKRRHAEFIRYFRRQRNSYTKRISEKLSDLNSPASTKYLSTSLSKVVPFARLFSLNFIILFSSLALIRKIGLKLSSVQFSNREIRMTLAITELSLCCQL